MHCPSPLCAVLAFLSTTISALALSNSNNLSSRRSNDYGIGTSATHKKYEDLTINNSKLSLAPMMNYTNRHFRAMIRLISSHTLLYTEMVAVDELLSTRQCDIHNLLGQSPVVPEGPSVLQLGGNDSSQIYQAANLYYKQSQTNELKYTSLNLNCGCPSLAVSGKKCFGAALMKDPLHVATLVRAMHEGVNGDLPISIKCRIGLHNDDATPFTPDMYNKQSQKEYDKLHSFIDTIAADGIVTNFIIHARIAVLGRGFSAADNRKIPPLNYDYVRRLTSDFPGLRFVLNGGIHSLHRAKEELEICDELTGVMVGRSMVADPWSGFAMTDELLYGDAEAQNQLCANRRELLQIYGRHVDYEECYNDPAIIRRQLVAPCAQLFAGEVNSKQFRMDLDEIAGRPKRLDKEAKARIWSIDTQSLGWDDLQAMDDARPLWNENEPPLSELILEAAQRNFGDDLLNLSRRESYDRKLDRGPTHAQQEENRILSIGSNGDCDKEVSGGVVEGWYSSGLN